MNLLSAENITLKYGERILLDNVSFGIAQGQKVALVGVNGSGKSTFLRILAGEEIPLSGQMAYRNGLNMAYLPQKPQLNPDHTVLEAAMSSGDPMMNLVREYEKCLILLNNNPHMAEKLADLSAQMDAMNAWSFESKVKEVLGRLGLHDLDKKVGTLSGGQQKRVGLARALLQEPELLLLDEPTNHLDLDVIEWLEEYLGTSQMSLIMVTHDRYFLESVTNEIIELDNSKLYTYQGNYSFFLEKKEERQINEQTVSDRARNLMRKELDWIRRQPKARGTKAKYRVEAFEDLKKQAAHPRQQGKVELDVSERRLGGKILELSAITKSFDGRTVVMPFSHVFKKGEKIGIVGKNGTGKTTFLEILAGRLNPDGGTIDRGINTHIGYFRQEEPVFESGRKVIEIVRDKADVIKLSDGSEVSSSQLLQRFNFSPSQQYDLVDKLSGGEKRRLQLLLVLLGNPNFLMLDEPTNDLDLITMQVLEEFLLQFAGCLVVVSHDRYFMDKMVDHLFIFEKDKKIRDFNGTYRDYRNEPQEEEEPARLPDIEKREKDKSDKQKVKLSFKEKREMETLESEMEKLNKKRAELISGLNSGSLDHTELRRTAEELEQLQEDLDEKEMRWLELSEKEN